MKHLFLLLGWLLAVSSLGAQIYVRPILIGTADPYTPCNNQALVYSPNLPSGCLAYNSIVPEFFAGDGGIINRYCVFTYADPDMSTALEIRADLGSGYVVPIAEGAMVPAGFEYDIVDFVPPSDTSTADGSYVIAFENPVNRSWLMPQFFEGIPTDTTWIDDQHLRIGSVGYGRNKIYIRGDDAQPTSLQYVATIYLGDPMILERPHMSAALDVQNASPGTCLGSAHVSTLFADGPVTYIWNIPQAGAFADSLCPGAYSVTVTDGADTVFLAFTLIEAPLEAVAVVDDMTYGCNGSVEIGSAYAEGPLTYVWSIPGQSGPSADSLCAGDYTVIVTDSSQDTVYVHFTITDNSPPLAVYSTGISYGASSCYAVAGIFVENGVAPVTIDWGTPGIPDNVTYADLLCPGDYDIHVTDGAGREVHYAFRIEQFESGAYVRTTAANAGCNGIAEAQAYDVPGDVNFIWSIPGAGNVRVMDNLCPGDYWVEVITEEWTRHLEFTITDETPHLALDYVSLTNTPGTCIGSVEFIPLHAIGPVTYTWSIPGAPNEPFLDSLCPGDYWISATDSVGYSYYMPFTIYEFHLHASVYYTVDALAGCNGKVEINAYSPSQINYAWSVPGVANEPVLDSLCPGDYSVLVTDMTGDTVYVEFTIQDITPDLQLQITNMVYTATCIGSVNVQPLYAVGPVTYEWSVSGAPNAPFIDSLCPGDYWVNATDSAGFSFYLPFTILEQQLEASVTYLAAATDGCNGVVMLYNNSSVPRNFHWSIPGAPNAEILYNLCPGDYSVFVTDELGVDTVYLEFTIPDHIPVLHAYMRKNDATSSMLLCDGRAAVTVYDQQGEVHYAWSVPGQPDERFLDSLCPGTYSVWVTDASGDSVYLIFEIAAGPELHAYISDTLHTSSVFTCDGAATVSNSGIDGAVHYAWSIPGAADEASIDSLCAGTYSVLVTDASGDSVYVAFEIQEHGPQLVAYVSDTVHNSSGLICAGSATISISGSEGPVDYVWSIPGAVNQPWIDSLCPGSYSVWVRDFSGDSVYLTFEIEDQSPQLAVGKTITHAPAGCIGTIEIHPSYAEGALSYLWSISGAPDSATLDSLCPGDYAVIVTDESGDTVQLDFTILDYVPQLQAAIISWNPYVVNCEGFVEIGTSEAEGAITFEWSVADAEHASIADSICVGDYWVRVSDESGDTVLINFTIKSASLGAFISNWTPAVNDCEGYIILGAYYTRGPVTYTWSIPGVGNSSEAYNLCAGDYWIMVSDTVDTVTVYLTIQQNGSRSAGTGSVALLGATELEKEALKIYPNPSSDYINVDAAGAVQIELFDAYGKLVRAGESSRTFIGDLAAGIYLVRVNGHEKLQRFVKTE